MSETKKPTILVIEDDQLVVRGALRQLRQRFNVLTSKTTKEGWSIFQTHQDSISAIFLDGILEDGNSVELLGLIRKSQFSGKIVSITESSEMRDSMFPSDPEKPRCDVHVRKHEFATYAIDHFSN